jgi:DNA-binding transcriptional MerR regulator
MTRTPDLLWTLDELGARVAQALAVDYPGQANGRVRDVPDRRTIRYYTTLGLLDRAAWWRGRTALYSLRHLLQLVAIKRLQANGLSLAEIQTRLAGLTDAGLRSIARLPAEFDPRDHSGETVRGADAKEGRGAERRFWAEVPAAVAPPSAAPVLVGVPLEPGVTLLLEGLSPPDEHDLSALRSAAAPLLKFLHARRLVGGEGATSTKGEST